MQVFINTYGTSIRVVGGMLSIKRETDIKKIPIGKIEKIFITQSIHLSSDVLYACIENGVDLIITERNGQPIGRLWNNRFGSISTIRKHQLLFSRSSLVLPWILNQIRKKALHQIELLYCLMSVKDPNIDYIEESVEYIRDMLQKLSAIQEISLSDASPRIRAIEGQIAKRYFRCVNEHLPFIYRFAKRTKHPARDMCNAMLNYVYGILYSHIESSLIKAGLDPYIGFFHRDEYNRPVLSYDVIESFRPWADWVVWHLCLNEVVDEEMFLIDQGAYWLHGDSKAILIQHFTDFFDEIVEYEGAKFKRFTHIDRLSAKLAKHIENFGDER